MLSLEEFKAKRGRQISKKYEIDLLIASLPENIYYYSNFDNVGLKILSTTQSYMVYNPYNEQKSLVVSASDAPTVVENANFNEIYCVGNFQFYIPNLEDKFSSQVAEKIEVRYSTALEALKAAIKKMAPNAKKVAVDESRIPIGTYRQLEASFPEIEFVLGATIFQKIRLIKHTDEIALIEKSANIAEESLATITHLIEPGISEYELGVAYATEIASRGAYPYFYVVTCDERAAFSDTCNQPFQKVKNGSVLRFDFGCIYQNYRSDLARTVVVGSNPKAEEYYKYILEGEETAIDAIKPGIRAEEVFDIAVKTVQKSMPHYARHHCGHGIGLEVYDPPSIAPGISTELQEGMTLCVETPYYEISWGGIQVEDTIVITKTGTRYLSNSSRKLLKVGE
jgi:Xaa-Pro aminopeptidase